MVPMDGDAIRVNGSLALPRGEVDLRFSRSSGPGGQHAQRNETRVEAVFDVDASATLTDAQKERVRERVGPVVRAIAQDERSQSRNRELALERVAEQLRDALRVRRTRRPTRPPRASKERRLAEQRRRAQANPLPQPPPE